MNLYIIILFGIILLASIATSNEHFNIYLGQPTKCFDCEAQLPPHLKYLGGPTKCFDCEKEIARRYGLQYSDLGQPTKCFDCEAQMGSNPMR